MWDRIYCEVQDLEPRTQPLPLPVGAGTLFLAHLAVWENEPSLAKSLNFSRETAKSEFYVKSPGLKKMITSN